MSRWFVWKILGFLLMTSAVSAKVVTDLDNTGGTLQYGTTGSFTEKMFHPPREGRVVILADLDGDGHDEAAFFNGRGVVAEQMGANHLGALWQVNIPVELAWSTTEGKGRIQRYGDLGLAADINSDGQDEIFLTIADPDRTRWFLFVIDPATESVAMKVELPIGPDRREDGYWDGIWEATGILPPGQASPHACLVLTSWVRYDAKPRGFTALDLVTGEIVWRFAMGGNPSNRQTWIGDLEGDGAWEIVATASGPDNLGGETFAGMSDDQSWLVVIDADGQLRRCSPQGGITSGDLMHVADLDSDGTREIITASVNVAQGQKESLRIFSPELELKARAVIPGRACGLSASAHADGSASIFLTTDAGIISRYRFREDHIDPPREATAAGNPCLFQHADLLPEPGLELLIAINNQQQLTILDEDLHPLFMTEPQMDIINRAMIWIPKPDTRLLVADNQNIYLTRLVKNPTIFPIWWVVGALAVILAMAAILIWSRRRKAKPHPASRDILARLLFDLEQSRHGTVNITRRLGQLQTLLSSLRSGLEVSPRHRPHTRRTYEDFAESDLLIINEILERAEAVGFEREVVLECRQARDRITANLDKLLASGLSPDLVDRQFPQLKKDNQALDEGLQTLRQRIEALFSCDLPRVLDRVMWAREFELERDGVSVQMPDLGHQNWSVLVDPKDLRFVLDNLVGNAILAMADSPRRHLTIDLTREAGSIACRVTDTGHGIADDVRRRLFHARFSTRDGGGLGLFRSRQLLSHWGGQIEIEHSEPGQGTTFLVQMASVGPRLRLVENPEEAAG